MDELIKHLDENAYRIISEDGDKQASKAEKGEYSNPHDNNNSGSTLVKQATNHCKRDYS